MHKLQWWKYLILPPKELVHGKKNKSINACWHKHTQKQRYKVGPRKSLSFKLLKMRNCHLFVLFSYLLCKGNHNLSTIKVYIKYLHFKISISTDILFGPAWMFCYFGKCITLLHIIIFFFKALQWKLNYFTLKRFTVGSDYLKHISIKVIALLKH